MRFTKTVTISLAIWLGLCIAHGSAIQCYHCNSHLNGECNDPFEDLGNGNGSSSILVDCDDLGKKDGNNYTFCRKTVQTATLRPDMETVRIVRSCAHLDDTRLAPGDDPSELRCYRRTGTYAVEILFCGCHTDGCNEGNMGVAGWGMVFLSAVAAVVGAFAQH